MYNFKRALMIGNNMNENTILGKYVQLHVIKLTSVNSLRYCNGPKLNLIPIVIREKNI